MGIIILFWKILFTQHQTLKAEVRSKPVTSVLPTLPCCHTLQREWEEEERCCVCSLLGPQRCEGRTSFPAGGLASEGSLCPCRRPSGLCKCCSPLYLRSTWPRVQETQHPVGPHLWKPIADLIGVCCHSAFSYLQPGIRAFLYCDVSAQLPLLPFH